MLLGKDEILKAKDTKTKRVDVPEWGGHVFVRSLPGGEFDDYEGENLTIDQNGKVEVNKKNIRARFLVRAICTEDGAPIFTLKDIDALSKKSGVALKRVCRVAERLNGMTAKSIEEAEKNSESGLGEDLPLPLPANSE